LLSPFVSAPTGFEILDWVKPGNLGDDGYVNGKLKFIRTGSPQLYCSLFKTSIDIAN